jgi:zinc protease
MRRYVQAFIIALLACTTSLASAQIAPKPGFPHERYKDFKPDPSVIYGTLGNGMRYAIKKWPTPKNEASIRLRIAAGSLNEDDNQTGLAHFLEHMAFNGSQNIPENELDKILSREGLAFGPDSNAYTSWDETVYQLDMPKSEKLELGLSIMRETAGRLTLAPDAIDRERGVVEGEERARQSPGERQFRAFVAHALDGTRIPDRNPIGDMKVIGEAARERFKDLYERFYTPERALLVVVGDFDPVATEALIKKQFSDWAAPAAPGKDPSLGTPKREPGSVRLLLEPQAATSVSLFNVKPYVELPDTSATRRDDLLLDLAQSIVNTRLERIARREGAPILSARIDTTNWFDAAETASLDTTARDPSKWQAALEISDQELRRALSFGFTADEFAVALAETREAYRRAAAQTKAKRSADLVNSILGSFANDNVWTTDADDLAWFEKIAPTLTPADSLAQLRKAWGSEAPELFVSSGAPIAGGEAAIKTAYDLLRTKAVTAPKAEAKSTWDYVKFGTTGQVASSETLADIGVTKIRFANNVYLTIKPTKFEEGRVRVSVNFGDGQLALPADQPGLAYAINSAFIAGGLGRLDVDALQRALAGRSVGTGFGVNEDAFSFNGSTTPSDLNLQLQVFAAFFTDPAWRPDGMARLKAAKDAIYREIDTTPGSVWGTQGSFVLYANNPRFAFPTPEQFDKMTLEAARTVVDAARKNSAIEVIIVGDTTVEAARDAVAATFGALSVRAEALEARTAERTVSFPPGRGTTVLTHKGRADQSLAMVYWPMRDYGDGREVRGLRILTAILQNRLTEVVREELGESYGPGTDWSPSRVFPGYGTLGALAEVKPTDSDKVLETVEAIAADLAAGKIDDDLFQRARRPLIADFDETTANNPWWLGALNRASFQPERLVRIREGKNQYASATLDEIKALAKRYLDPAKARLVKVVPGPDATPVSTPTP